MKTCCRQLLSIVLLFSFSCVALGVDGFSAPGAVLRASGKVQVNGAASRETTTLFAGDSIETDEDSVANITPRDRRCWSCPILRSSSWRKMVELSQGACLSPLLRGWVP